MNADDAWLSDLEVATAHSAEAAWRIMALRSDFWRSDSAVGLHYCLLSDRFPEGADLSVLESIAEEAEGSLLVAALAALNRIAARRPLDAPTRAEGPEHTVARLAAAALEADGVGALAGYFAINLANARRALGPEQDAAALEAYAIALAHDPERGAWHLDHAVCHKWRGRWQPCLDAVLRARSRLGETRAVLWNLALAATALGDGDLAAGAWKSLGFEGVRMSGGGLPFLEGVPPRRIRVRSKPSGYGVVAQDAGFEVLNVAPLSPAHGVVSSASFEDAPLDFGDIVLWDGAPVASDELGPIFPALERLRAGDERRHRFVAIIDEVGLANLREALGEGVRLFVHDGDPAAEPSGERLMYGKIVSQSVSDASLRTRLEAYGAKARTLRLAAPALYEALGDSRRAGQEHQAWRGVERAAIKRGLVPSRG
ncbi:MAG: hypothetical protein AAF411_08865 [Myxococcota bacterium]